jgi:hypothetical protein
MAIADALSPQQSQTVKADLEKSSVVEAAADGSRFLFNIDGYQRSKYLGQHALPVEGTMSDRDGVDLHVLLHVDENERLFELELVRWAEGPVIEPNWSSFRVRR